MSLLRSLLSTFLGPREEVANGFTYAIGFVTLIEEAVDDDGESICFVENFNTNSVTKAITRTIILAMPLLTLLPTPLSTPGL